MEVAPLEVEKAKQTLQNDFEVSRASKICIKRSELVALVSRFASSNSGVLFEMIDE